MSSIGEQVNYKEMVNPINENGYDIKEIKRGEVWYCDLEGIGYTSVHVQEKTRPALVIQNNVGNAKSETIIVALLTSKDKKPYPFQYHFVRNNKVNVVMFEQIFTIDSFRLTDKMFELTPQQLQEADKALMYSLQLNKLSLENICDFNVVSLTTKKTLIKTETYFEFEFVYTGGIREISNIPLETLQQFDKDINVDIGFNELKNKFDSLHGLHWLVTHNTI